jgi:ADP-ribose pyrophosphatase YjhB (NUDIX family)/rhodanese-related sulfurtransferase
MISKCTTGRIRVSLSSVHGRPEVRPRLIPEVIAATLACVTGVDDLLTAARDRLGHRPTPEEAAAAVAAGALLVDIRPVEQRQRDGSVPGAVVIERNVLEWRLDPASHWRHAALTSADQPVIVLCNEGYQSSLAAAGLLDLGCTSVTDLDGGFQAWRAAGLPIEMATPDVVALAEELQAIGRAGLHFATDPFDRERYERLVDLAARTYAQMGSVDNPVIRDRFAQEVGCITPKVGADAAIVDEEGRLLLVERADDRCWGLISGWVEPGEHPAETVVREAKEEVGLDVAVGELLGVFHRPASSATGPHAVVSVVYRTTVTGGEITLQPHEVLAVRWWHADDVPAWHLDHETRARAALAP